VSYRTARAVSCDIRFALPFGDQGEQVIYEDDYHLTFGCDDCFYRVRILRTRIDVDRLDADRK
jgi:hypothetical protein